MNTAVKGVIMGKSAMQRITAAFLIGFGGAGIATAQDFDPGLIAAVKTATSKPDVVRALAAASAPVSAEICAQTTWAGADALLTKYEDHFTRHALSPTIDRGDGGGFVHFFAWGPDLDDLIDRENPDLGAIYLNFWITIELKDWGTHRSLTCEYAALDNGGDILPIAESTFLEQFTEVTQTAYHDAPMLHQTPDRLQIKLLQSADQTTKVEIRGGNARIDVRTERRLP